jgi:hypothetical protein
MTPPRFHASPTSKPAMTSHHMRHLSLFSIWCLCIPSIAIAQTMLQPGDRRIHPEWLKPTHDAYRTVVLDSTGHVRYDFIMDDFTIIDSAARQVIFARSRQVPPGSFSTDTSVTDLSFRPLRMHETHAREDVQFEMRFGDTVASVTTTRKGVPSSKTYPMKKGYFEDNMIEYIVGYLDLQKGVVYTLDNFNKDTPSPSDPFTLEYVFDDTWFVAADQQIPCLMLRFTHGATTGYIWVDKRTRQVLKEAGQFTNGSYIVRKL